MNTSYDMLLARLRELEKENAEFRYQLGLLPSIPQCDTSACDGSGTLWESDPMIASIHKFSPPQKKIALFRSLFRGREDVYARRWQSIKTGKSGYSPACGNEWQPGVCPKPKGYQKRIKAYASIGYHVKGDTETPLTKDLIYDGKSFYSVFCQDLKNAEKEILIVSPFMTKTRLQKLIQVLTEPLLRGVMVKAVVCPAENLPFKDRSSVPDNVEYLMDYGVQVVFRTGFHQKYTVIDGRISWYGSVNILSFGKAEESVMRIESAEIAGELIDTVTKEAAAQ